MKRQYPVISAILFIAVSSLTLYSQPDTEFINRRNAVRDKMEPGSVMIIRSVPEYGRFDNGRVGGLLYYLTGTDESGCTLILYPGNSRQQPSSPAAPGEIMFIEPVNSSRINWDAQTLGIEGAKMRSGIKDVRSDGEARSFIGQLLVSPLKVLYLDAEKSASVYDAVTPDEQLIRSAMDRGATFSLKSPSEIINSVLSQKSAFETGQMRKVIDITAAAQREAARSLKAGMYEYQLDAIIRYIFSINGSGSVSFPGIIGSGINSVVLHWMENSRKMENGDLVVVDCGAEKNMYCADITRTYPVSGRYSSRQKEIYDIVLQANEEAIKLVAPGIKMSEVSARADSVIADGLLRVGLISDRRDFKKYYYHGLSHQIGLKGAPGGLVTILEPGMVITIEPGIYIRDEKLGVRIEDDVLVTTSGHEVLSSGAPKQTAEIEKLMKEEGLDPALKLVE